MSERGFSNDRLKPTIIESFIRMSVKAKLLVIVGFAIGAVTGGALYGPGLHTRGSDAQLSYFPVRTHDNDGIERGSQSEACFVDGLTGPGSRIWSISPERRRICTGSA